MTLVYPSVHARKPLIIVLVIDLLAGKEFLFPMLLDTGADVTCFPSKFAAFFGHDNQHPKVMRDVCCGIGGNSISYIHSVQLGLIDPQKSTKVKQIVAWTSKQKTAAFVEKLDSGFGLLGMDIISQWKAFELTCTTNRLVIKVEI